MRTKSDVAENEFVQRQHRRCGAHSVRESERERARARAREREREEEEEEEEEVVEEESE
jgi:hypothetical protein